MDLQRTSIDEIFSQLVLSGPPIQSASTRKALFWGEGVGEISSYVAGWMVGKGIDVIVLDGANRFNPYVASSLARKALIPPERLLKKIRIARAFTCYQMANLIGEKLVSLLHTKTVRAIHACTPNCGVSARRHESPLQQKPWVILLGPITTFLDEDVPEREVRPLFERALGMVEKMAMRGIPFFIFQPTVFPENPPNPPLIKGGKGGLMDSRRAYLARRLFRFSNLVWKVSLEEQGPKVVLEKGLAEKIPNDKHQITNKFQLEKF